MYKNLDAWKLLSLDNFPPANLPIVALVESKDGEAFVVKLIRVGDTPFNCVWKLVEPEEYDDPILLQQNSIIAWRPFAT